MHHLKVEVEHGIRITVEDINHKFLDAIRVVISPDYCFSFETIRDQIEKKIGKIKDEDAWEIEELYNHMVAIYGSKYFYFHHGKLIKDPE